MKNLAGWRETGEATETIKGIEFKLDFAQEARAPAVGITSPQPGQKNGL